MVYLERGYRHERFDCLHRFQIKQVAQMGGGCELPGGRGRVMLHTPAFDGKRRDLQFLFDDLPQVFNRQRVVGEESTPATSAP